MVTKSDFLLYMEAPMHLWAKAHGQLEEATPSLYDQHLMKEGYAVEKLAKEYVKQFVLPQYAEGQLWWQRQFVDGEFEAIADAVIYDSAEHAIDIFEIKSSTSVHKEHLYDATFQTLVSERFAEVRQIHILHLNKNYMREGDVDLRQLFVADNIREQVEVMRDEVRNLREQALTIVGHDQCYGVQVCAKPDVCPSLSLCHPLLPEHHIYTIPRINGKKSSELREDGIEAIEDIPDDYPLSPLQQKYVTAVKTGRPIIKQKAIAKRLSELVYPIHFLDYETYNSAVPLFDRYHPQQCMTFQYSLHVFESPTSEPKHLEYLCTDQSDPAAGLLHHLREDMADTGSVVVWNKGFEGGRNSEMGQLYPEYETFLLGVNERLFDLMEIFFKGLYVDARFKGSASIKKVLPVLVPSLSYDHMAIGKGDMAMMAWWEMIHQSAGPGPADTRHPGPDPGSIKIKENLLRYCALDTWAMVEIWKALQGLSLK